MSIRIMTVDDQDVVRHGIAALVSDTEIEVVAEATNGADAIELVQQVQPDVVLLDVRMPECDGLAALGRIKLESPELPVLIFSAYDNPNYVARAVALGANGYVLKTASRDEILDKIRGAAAGKQTWQRAELRRVTGALAAPSSSTNAEIPFTRREQDVLTLLADGKTNREIASDLELSYETVKEHVQHLLRKIGVSDRTQAAVWAVRRGIT